MIAPIVHAGGVVSLPFVLILALLGLAMLLTVVRLVIGPTLADRVIAIDLLATEAIAAIAVYAMAFNKSVIIDVAIVLALIAFVGTVAFARYLEKRVEQ